jgi:hypothetical protein
MTNTITGTGTYTKIDIRKTFEGFDADVRMIARRTGKWSTDDAEKRIHDIIKLAEEEYLESVCIVLKGYSGNIIQATKFVVNNAGTAMNAERAGANDWSDIPNTSLSTVLSYTAKWHALTSAQQEKFASDNSFKINWTSTSIDTSFSHLTKSTAQLYASKGYELQKQNYR